MSTNKTKYIKNLNSRGLYLPPIYSPQDVVWRAPAKPIKEKVSTPIKQEHKKPNKKKRHDKRLSPRTPQEKHQKKSYAELLHISIKKDDIRVGEKSFRRFVDAINYIENQYTENEMFRHLQIEYLRGKYDLITKDLWTPWFKKNFNQRYIAFSDVYEEMKGFKTPLTTERARFILGLCNDCISEEIRDNESYFYLRDAEYRYPAIHQSLQAKEVVDDCTMFKAEYIDLLQQTITGDSEDIYVGLDFGTSFTKCAYQLDENNKGVFMFGDTPFKSTVVYLSEDENLSFFKPEGKSNQIKYFKATMVSDRNVYSELRYSELPIADWLIRENFEMLCSSFFIANIICYMRHKLNKHFNVSPELQIAMGVPLSEDYSNQKIYNRALHAGIYIADKVDNPTTMSLSQIYDLFLKSGTSFENDLYSAYPNRISHCTIPELFTESLYLLNRTDYMPGYYYVVDIGGGTADFAFIKKEYAQFKTINADSFHYHCPSAKVFNLGNEVRKALKNDIPAIKEYIHRFSVAYGSIIAKAKRGMLVNDQIEVRQLWFGGGAVDPSHFYQKKLSVFQSGLKSIDCKVIRNTEEEIINSFIPNNLNLTEEDKQRLIIATQLSIPNTSDAYLSSRPENYDPQSVLRIRKVDIEDNNPGYDDIN